MNHARNIVIVGDARCLRRFVVHALTPDRLAAVVEDRTARIAVVDRG